MGKHEEIPKKRIRWERIFLVLVIIWLIYKILCFLTMNHPQDIGKMFVSTGTLYNPENSITEEEKIKEVEIASLDQEVVIEKLPDIDVTMAVIGDIMCHNTQYMDANKGGVYDFSYVFEDIKKYIEPADVAIGNLETTFAGKDVGYSSYPTFNTPEALATDLKELGIDVLSTANNHSLDKGYKGITKTIEELDKAGVSHTGTYSSQESANQILIKEIKGIKFAFLAYTYGTNGISIPSGKEYCINLINKDKIAGDIGKAKKQGAEVIVVNMHWGEEYQASPNATQKELAQFLFDNGVNIILGSHPHVLQRMETVEIKTPEGKKQNNFVIYSLGNFVSGQLKAHTRQSVILNIKLTKSGKDGSINVQNVDYVPIYTFRENHYRILDINSVIKNYENGVRTYGSGMINTLKTELDQINERIK